MHVCVYVCAVKCADAYVVHSVWKFLTLRTLNPLTPPQVKESIYKARGYARVLYEVQARSKWKDVDIKSARSRVDIEWNFAHPMLHQARKERGLSPLFSQGGGDSGAGGGEGEEEGGRRRRSSLQDSLGSIRHRASITSALDAKARFPMARERGRVGRVEEGGGGWIRNRSVEKGYRLGLGWGDCLA